jgi:glycosyltransferase involved in cell wall biosynthesis
MLNLSLIIPCYNEAPTIDKILAAALLLHQQEVCGQEVNLELILVFDGSTDQSLPLAQAWALDHPQIKILSYAPNRGKGYAIRQGLQEATGDYVGIQDADLEYHPQQYLKLLSTLIANKADVVYGSRYLMQDQRRILSFWHSLTNHGLTLLTNMFTNLDLTDMETCQKLFTQKAMRTILPQLQENRFGIEPEITIQIAKHHLSIYECAITYRPRTFAEGKKIRWTDGLHALYCILHYGAPTAPLPMQIILYFFIGLICACTNVVLFACGHYLFFPHLDPGIIIIMAFLGAAALNYVLCIKVLFEHQKRKGILREIGLYLLVVLLMGWIDYILTIFGQRQLNLAWPLSKSITAPLSFGLNFIFRKYLVFSLPQKKNQE